jgi:zinc transporter 7
MFNIQNIKILDVMSAFASGALLGDVMLHNLPEILDDSHGHESHPNDSQAECSMCFLKQKEALICLGVIVLFMIEKIISLYTKNLDDEGCKENEKVKDSHGHSHGHSHGRSKQNIIISLIGDFVHNLTDGLAIGAAYATSIFFIF